MLLLEEPEIRVGVVGVGAFGRHHVRLLGELPGAKLMGITDIDQARGESQAAERGTNYFASAEELAPQVQAVSIAVPPAHHAETARFFLERGVDVFVEKPLAATVPEAEGLIALAAEKGRMLQVGHIERFNPIVRALLPHIHSPLFIEVHRLAPFPERSLDVDVVLDLMIHDLDLILLWVGEEPEDVRAAGVPVLSSKGDISNARLEFPSGCVANLTASRVSLKPTRKFRVFSENSYVSLDLNAARAERYTRKPGPLEQGGMPVIEGEIIEMPPGNPLRDELAAFVECVRSRTSPEVSGMDGLRVLRVAHQILADTEARWRKRSQREGQGSRAMGQG